MQRTNQIMERIERYCELIYNSFDELVKTFEIIVFYFVCIILHTYWNTVTYNT